MLEGIVLAMVIVVAAAIFMQAGNADQGAALASPTTGAQATPNAGSSMSPHASTSRSAATSPSAAGVSPTPASTFVASPAPSPTRTATPRPTSPPRASGDPHLAYADFLRRVNDDRSKVDELNRALSSAVTAGDRESARVAAVAILDFVDGERQWLLDHPPADCYATAHASGVAMLEAYQTAASLFVDWAASSGLESLVALGKAADAATVAANALTAFGEELGRTQCPA